MHFVKSILAAFLALMTISTAHTQSLPGGFVYLRDIDPSIIQDIRYATSNNFVGRPLAGYGVGECVVKREIGLRLKAVQQELVAQNLSLKMFDCYRPARASLDMVRWSQNGQETVAERRYNPKIPKTELFRLGASRSQHSTGAALDLTLVDLKADNSGKYDPSKAYADCTAPVEARPPEGSVDMGTGYDCTDAKGHTAAPTVSPDQRAWRKRLVAAMARQGFVNYAKEWWHFSLPGAGGAAYDFPIPPRMK
ncbi:M15 family metallopeptidase [Bradyrhizobium sp. 135]|uniref:M15 family metallopeptidase n=1 Tax=Bradyrhizobium sp. 135 TaxID=2782612 RepID=UPI001FF773D5|nr:M15 family metallopeptidase [Bradyrhizobium sp. 135]MCK1748015.1 M15 family metallopeptidase [Bradyrhizobium sp. 135]